MNTVRDKFEEVGVVDQYLFWEAFISFTKSALRCYQCANSYKIRCVFYFIFVAVFNFLGYDVQFLYAQLRQQHKRNFQDMGLIDDGFDTIIRKCPENSVTTPTFTPDLETKVKWE